MPDLFSTQAFCNHLVFSCEDLMHVCLAGKVRCVLFTAALLSPAVRQSKDQPASLLFTLSFSVYHALQPDSPAASSAKCYCNLDQMYLTLLTFYFITSAPSHTGHCQLTPLQATVQNVSSSVSS